MESPDWFAITRGDRQRGRTTVMAEAARKINGYLVVRNRNEAERVEREHGAPCISIFESEKMRGRMGPILFDPDAVGMICAEYDRQIYELGGQLQRVKDDLSKALVALARKPRRKKARGKP